MGCVLNYQKQKSNKNKIYIFDGPPEYIAKLIIEESEYWYNICINRINIINGDILEYIRWNNYYYKIHTFGDDITIHLIEINTKLNSLKLSTPIKEICFICLEETILYYKMNCCNHYFHLNCIKGLKSVNCTICKQNNETYIRVLKCKQCKKLFYKNRQIFIRTDYKDVECNNCIKTIEDLI